MARLKFPPRCMPTGMPRPPAPSAKPPGTSALPPTAPAFPELAADFTRRMAGELPANFAEIAVQTVARRRTTRPTPWPAARPASWRWKAFTAALPELLGGSADLTGSNLTNTKSTPALRVDDEGNVVKTEDGQIGRHINYGVREFGMAAIMNGVALHGGYIPYGGTFLTFSDYSRNAIRMAALMQPARDPCAHARLRLAWAKTARRTSPSSTPPACA